MRKLLILLLIWSTSAFAQDFKKEWEKVVKLEDLGFVKQANAAVEKISKKAERQKNDAQLVKCFFYQSKYLQTLDAQAQIKTLVRLKDLSAKSSGANRAIFCIIYAKCLKNYLRFARYENQRTETVGDSIPDDLLLWSRENFESEMERAYSASLANKELLKKTKLSQYEPVFDYVLADKFSNRTLFDWVISENITYRIENFHEYRPPLYKTDETLPFLTGNPDKFSLANFDTISLPKHRELLKLMQSREQNRPDISNRISRLDWLFGKSREAGKALENLRKDAKDSTDIDDVRFALAQIYKQDDSRENKVKALAMLDSVIVSKRHSNASMKALKLKNEIVAKSLHVEIARFRYPGEPSRARLAFRNLDSISISCFKVKAAGQEIDTYGNQSEKLKLISGLKPMISRSIALKNPGDYRDHSTEILLPELPVGTYVVVISAKDIDGKSDIKDAQVIVVSNLAYIKSDKIGNTEFSVVSRDKGKPVFGVKAAFKDRDLEFYSDGNNKLRISQPAKPGNLTGWISKGADSLYVSQYRYVREKQIEKPSAKLQFYLDRAIYRPGQKVLYKGILMQKDSLGSGVIANARLIVKAYDANNKAFFTKEVNSNEFGSFSGAFDLPKDLLTGNFRLSAEKEANILTDENGILSRIANFDASISFKVEEYKRPKFEVILDPIKETLLLGKVATVSGNAKSLAGSVVSNAKVSWIVTLETISYAIGGRDSVDEIVSQDSLFSDAGGRFTIKFPTNPSENEEDDQRAELPVYNYRLEVSVTDLNGETRTATREVNVARHALSLDFSAHELEISKDNLVEVVSNNLNGEPKPTKGKLEFFRTQKLASNFKSRFFNAPEIPGFTASEFAELFPNEVDESLLDVGNDTLAKKTIHVDTKVKTSVEADLSKLEPGIYNVVFSVEDEFGFEVSAKRQFTIRDPKQKIDRSKLFTIRQINEFPEKDSFANFIVTSPVPDLNVHIAASDAKNTFFEQDITLKNHEFAFKVEIPKTAKTGISVLADSFYDNAFESETASVTLPIVKTQLKVETISYKNLIEPGSPQTFSFRIKPENAALESEVLASMYDASLDVFAKSEWVSPQFFDYSYYHGNRRNASENRSVNLNLKSKLPNSYGSWRPENPVLMQFGYDPDKYRREAANRLYKTQMARKAKPSNAKLVYGKVTDEYGAIANAKVGIKNTDRYVLTDDEGYYEIEASDDETLRYFVLGYSAKEITSVGYGRKDVNLVEEDNSIYAVEVSGDKGIQRKASAMTSVVQIVKNMESSDTPKTTLELVGKVSGLQIETTNSGVNASTRIVLRGNRSTSADNSALVVIDGKITSMAEFQAMNPDDIVSISVIKGAQGAALYGSQGANGVVVVSSKKAFADLGNVRTRTNLSETAFFFPHLKTDEKGNVLFSFTSPESLTTWKLRLFAHNKKGVSGQIQQKIVTQKSLMLTPNFPRFLREKDSIVISVKISNMTAKVLDGNAMLQLSDAATMQPIDAISANSKNLKTFRLSPTGNSVVDWKIAIPEGLSGVHYKVVAKSGDFSDGEENIIPVVSNRMLITESKPLWIREHSTKEVTFEQLKNNKSSTLKNHQMTLEFTSNPVWLALGSLPYLIEYEHECAEQTFARFYANAVASSVIESNPKIADVFTKWRQNGKGKLEQNQELKSILVNETPWFNDALSESDKKKRLALLFDLEQLKSSKSATLEKLRQKQKESGGFAWFDGGIEDEFITRHIASGIGHLKKLGISKADDPLSEIGKKAISYLDDTYIRRKLEVKSQQNRLRGTYSDLHYLYARSFYLAEIPLKPTLSEEIERDLNEIISNRLQLDVYQKAMSALVLHRFGKSKQAREIVDNLRETSATDETNGMFWVENTQGWNWFRAPIETQALLIETFLEVSDDQKSAQAMKAWLIKNKQRSHWPSTKSTTEAVYALLLQGGNWINVKDDVVFKVGSEKILLEKLSQTQKEAETGYMKIDWNANEITPEMATLKVENKSDVPVFGGFYWQYFEDLDKVVRSEKGILTVNQELLRKTDASDGEKFQRITVDAKLKVGDLLTVRVTVKVSEDLEYVHLKSMRAACFEPVDVLSGYRWKPNSSYYESTKDVATHFFFDRLKAGSYEFEYEVRVNNSGDFSNGIATVQSMYAPEFSAHSKGVRIKSSRE
ncbi:alpha-2-macroglobulin family protein [Flavobacterium sp.]|uniref:alpha-2-macroglobulin family protein n=1 Tax=Flavobacterium sp. TaxID=239 RepID=UPI00121D0BFB|nr:alpha-2-macroglobulin family protein [Flavobacterium sp.]RZJ70030.1 MAG: hypothetical protein EOO49_15360 [Flavobacterium sp.]